MKRIYAGCLPTFVLCQSKGMLISMQNDCLATQHSLKYKTYSVYVTFFFSFNTTIFFNFEVLTEGLD